MNLGTAFGMGLIVCTFMLSQPAAKGESYGTAVAVGLLGAVVGSIVSGRLMLRFTKRAYGLEAEMISDGMQDNLSRQNDRTMRPVRSGSVGARLMDAVLTGGAGGVKMGLGIVPGVLTICTFVMMLTNGPGAEGYTGAAYEGIRLLPMAAERLNFLLQPLFGFSSPECVSVPITAMGAAGAAIGLVPGLLSSGLADAGDVAVFTAMCMCWSGYISTHVSMMDELGCKELIGKALLSHTIGGVAAGAAAHYLFLLVLAI